MDSEKKYSEKIEKELERVRNLVKTARQNKNLSQNKLAEMLGMTSQNYRLIEMGETELKYPLLLKLMDILGIDSIEKSENDKPKYAIDNDFMHKLMRKVENIEQVVMNGSELNKTIQIGKNDSSKQLGENEHKEDD